MRTMELGGLLADPQLEGNLLIQLAGDHPVENVLLACCQVLEMLENIVFLGVLGSGPVVLSQGMP